MITFAITTVIATSLVYWLTTAWFVDRFFRRRRGDAAQLAKGPASCLPAVSVLKPVQGGDGEMYENLVSFCRQQYPRFELLFGVSDPHDRAVALVTRCQQEYPHLAIRCAVAPRRGRNPKSSILQELVSQARFPVLVISDGDIRVGPDYLARLAPALEEPSVGLVTCPYRGGHSRSFSRLATRLDALYLESDFLPSVILAHRLFGVPVGLGATIALRRKDLEQVGGYQAIVDYLSDDYQIAARIAGLGLRIRLSDYIVDHMADDAGLCEQWNREIRWARGIRARCLWQYLGQFLKFGTPLAVALVLLEHTPPAWGLLLASLAVRWTVAWRMQRHLGRPVAWPALAWLPIRDVLSLAVWLAALAGRRIRWRGQEFWLDAAGRLEPARPSLLRRLGTVCVRALDGLLRRAQGIEEFSQDQRCICRIALVPCREDTRLPDGTCIAPDEVIGELHFWNEHLPSNGPDGSKLQLAAELWRRAVLSLTELTTYIRAHPELQQIKAWRVITSAGSRRQARAWARILARLGFGPPQGLPRSGLWRRCHDFGEDLLLGALTWTFNPGAMRGRDFRRQRYRCWLPQSVLLARYAKDHTHVSPLGSPGLVRDGGMDVHPSHGPVPSLRNHREA